MKIVQNIEFKGFIIFILFNTLFFSALELAQDSSSQSNHFQGNLIRAIPTSLKSIAAKSNNSNSSIITPQHIAILESKAYEVSDKTYVESKKDPSKGFVDLIAPKNTQITQLKPLFKWNAIPGVKKYEFKLINSIKTLWTTETNFTELTLSDDAPMLERGKFYFWAIKAVGVSNYYSPYSYFYIATDNEDIELKKSIKDIEANINTLNAPEKDIILASFYESKGFYEDAENHYNKAMTEITNSADIKDLQTLLGNLYVKTDRLNKAIDLLGLKNK
ncbi:MAG: tetratricopeptide repeat protein [Cyanobacteriota bacterium]